MDVDDEITRSETKINTKSRVNSSLKPFIEVKENGLILKVLSFLISKGRCPTQKVVPPEEKGIFTEERRLSPIKGGKINKVIGFVIVAIVLCYLIKCQREWLTVQSLSMAWLKVKAFAWDRAVDILIKKLRQWINHKKSIDQ